MKPKAAYTALTQVIDQMTADTLDRNTIESLRAMLDMGAFQPIRDVVEKKIIEVGNYLKSKDTPKPEPVMVWMGKTQEKKVESNDALREEMEEFLNSPPFEYENPADVRTHFDQVKQRFEDSLEFDILLEPLPNK